MADNIFEKYPNITKKTGAGVLSPLIASSPNIYSKITPSTSGINSTQTGVPYNILESSLGEHITNQPLSSTYAGGIFDAQDILLKTVPQKIGGGQYLQRKEQEDKKLYDLYTPRSQGNSAIDRYLRGGFSGYGVEIDHIIPLWLDGADTLANKESLTIVEHNKKSGVENVVRTMLEKGIIQKPEARVMAMSWRDKDIEPFFNQNQEIPLNDNNLVPDDIFSKIVQAWKTPEKVGLGDMWNAIIGSKKGKKYDTIRQNVTQITTTPTKEFAQAVASGITFGWIPTSQAQYKTEEEQKIAEVARVGGQVVGGIAGFTWLGKALGVVGLALKPLTKLLGLGKLATSFSKAVPVGKIIPEITKEGLAGIGRMEVGKNIVARIPQMMASAGLFAVGGQISRQEENTIEERMKRLAYDVSLGSLMGASGQRLKDYANIGAGTFALSYLESGDIKTSAADSLMMAGLHGLGRVGYKKELVNAQTEELSNRFSANYLKKANLLSKETPDTFAIKNESEYRKYITKAANMFKGKVGAKINNKVFTETDAVNETSKALTAIRQLWIRGLPKERRITEQIKDWMSIFKMAKVNNKFMDKYEVKKVTPSHLDDFINKNILEGGEIPGIPGLPGGALVKQKARQNIKNLSIGASSDIQIAPETIPKVRGEFFISGTSKDTNKFNAEAVKFFDEENKRGEPLVGLLVESDAKIAADGKDVELYVASPNDVRFVGMVSDKKQITKRIAKFENKDRFSIDNDRVALYDGMKKTGNFPEGVQIVPVEISKITSAAEISKEPAIGIRINEGHWKNAILWKQKYKELEPARIASEVENTRIEQEETNRTTTDYIKEIPDVNINDDLRLHRRNINDYLDIVTEELRDGTPQSLMNKINVFVDSPIMTLQQAENVFRNKNLFSSKDALKLVFTGNTLTERVNSLFESNRSLHGDKEYQEWLKKYGDRPILPAKAKEVVEEIKQTMLPFIKEPLEKPIEVIQPKTEKEQIKEIQSQLPIQNDIKTKTEGLESREWAEELESNRITRPSDWTMVVNKTLEGTNKLINERQKGLNKGSQEYKDLKQMKKMFSGGSIKKKADETMANHNNDPRKAFEEFKSYYADLIKGNLKASDPFKGDTLNKFKQFFNRTVQLKPRKSLVLDKKWEYEKGKQDVFWEEPKISYEPSSEAGEILERYGLDIMYFENKAKSKDPGLLKKIDNEMKNRKYVFIGTSGNKIETTTGVKYSQKIADRITKENAFEKYLNEGEKLDDFFEKLEDSPEVGNWKRQNRFIRAMTVDLLKFNKSVEASELLKRWKIYDAHEVINPIKGEKYKLVILKSKTMGETNQVEKDKLRKDYSEEALKALFDKGYIDGKIYMTEKKFREILDAMGMDKEKTRIKPFMKALINNELMLQKGDITILDDASRSILEKQLGRKITDNDIITFQDNIKVGLKDKDALIQEIEVPSESFRFKYGDKHRMGGTLSPSVLGKFFNKDSLNDLFKSMYASEMKEYKKIVKDAKSPDLQNNVIKYIRILEDKYGINIEEGLFDKIKNKIELGAGFKSLDKQIDGILNNIFKERILNGSFMVSDHIHLTPDLGFKNGKFLQSNEIMISYDKWIVLGKPEELLLMRYPVTRKGAMIKAKVIVGDKYGINNLKKDQIILSNYDVYTRLEGDFDGDSIALFKVGEGGVPQQFVNIVEKLREEQGDILLKPLSKFPKGMHITKDNLMKVSEQMMLGSDAVDKSSANIRILSSLIDANFKVRTDSAGKISFYFGNDTKPYAHATYKDKQGGEHYITTTDKNKEFEVDYGPENEKLFSLVQQASTDSSKSPELSELLNGEKVETYLIKKLFKVDDPNIIKAINNKFFDFQDIFTLGQGEHTYVNNVEIKERMDKANALLDKIEKSGGKISPVMELVRLMKGYEPFEMFSNPIKVTSDNYATKAVSEQFKRPDNYIKSSKQVENFVRQVESAKTQYNKAGDAEKKDIYQSIVDYFYDNYNKFDNKDIDNIVYFLTTDERANLFGPVRGKKTYVYRIDELLSESPEIGKTYFKAFEEYK